MQIPFIWVPFSASSLLECLESGCRCRYKSLAPDVFEQVPPTAALMRIELVSMKSDKATRAIKTSLGAFLVFKYGNCRSG